jgi:hypothetical protein
MYPDQGGPLLTDPPDPGAEHRALIFCHFLTHLLFWNIKILFCSVFQCTNCSTIDVFHAQSEKKWKRCDILVCHPLHVLEWMEVTVSKVQYDLDRRKKGLRCFVFCTVQAYCELAFLRLSVAEVTKGPYTFLWSLKIQTRQPTKRGLIE